MVVKTAMKDTATVAVSRYVKHAKYKKYQVRTKKFLAHDPGNTVAVGDAVTIVALRAREQAQELQDSEIIYGTAPDHRARRRQFRR